jgi:hypothetical protein
MDGTARLRSDHSRPYRAVRSTFSPGALVKVQSPHYMEVAVQDRIVDELQKVIAKA